MKELSSYEMEQVIGGGWKEVWKKVKGVLKKVKVWVTADKSPIQPGDKKSGYDACKLVSTAAGGKATETLCGAGVNNAVNASTRTERELQSLGL